MKYNSPSSESSSEKNNDYTYVGELATLDFHIELNLPNYINLDQPDLYTVAMEHRTEFYAEIKKTVHETFGDNVIVSAIRIEKGSLSVAVVLGTIKGILVTIATYKSLVESLSLLKTQLANMFKRYFRTKNIDTSHMTVQSNVVLNAGLNVPTTVTNTTVTTTGSNLNERVINYLIFSNILFSVTIVGLLVFMVYYYIVYLH